MSLFRARELWATQCGAGDECFDQGSLAVCDRGDAAGAVVVVGSHGGCVRAYEPCAAGGREGGYRPADMLLERQLPAPVLQVAAGRLVSGSHQQQLCVLHPRSVAVYSLVTTAGEAEHGDQSHLALAYEHQLPRSATCMVLGPFGGAKGRDFICVQSLDGTLSVFEQEVPAFHRCLPGFLLPGPLAFAPLTDSFITVSSDWHVKSYRYQVLAEAGGAADQTMTSTGRKVFPDWTHNLGEGAVSVEAVSWSAADCQILVLGQRSLLLCLTAGGTLVFAKRLEYRPRCFHPYFVEPAGRLMVLVVSDTGVLLVYERARLRWCALLEQLPATVCRADLRACSIRGALVMLSDAGQLQCCYLGTQPSLFTPPPPDTAPIAYQQAEQQLRDLNRTIREHAKTDTASLADAAAERELSIALTSRLQEREPPCCAVRVELTPLVPLSCVQVSVVVRPPLAAGPVSHSISSLCEKTAMVTEVRQQDIDCDVFSLEVRTVVSYVAGSGGTPRVLQKTAWLPLGLVMTVCPPTKEADFKITLNINQPSVPLSQLFPELVTDGSLAGAGTAAGFRPHGRPGAVVSVLAARSSQRYRLQTDALPVACVLTTELERRLAAHFRTVAGFACSYASPLPVHQLLAAVDEHHACRVAVRDLQAGLERAAAQYRTVQRRLLAKLKERSPAPLAGLDVLLGETHRLLMNDARRLQEACAALHRASCALASLVSLVLLLLRLTDEACARDLGAALAYCPQLRDHQDWEEVTDAAMTYLLRTSLARSGKDCEPTAAITLVPTSDASRLKKHIGSAIDRLFKSVNVFHGEEGLPRAVSPIPEGEETPRRRGDEEGDEAMVPVSCRFAERKLMAPPRGRSALLSALKARTEAVHAAPITSDSTGAEADEESGSVAAVSMSNIPVIESAPSHDDDYDDVDLW
ncbi:protein PTHB1 isoform X2 [Bacillus rossius redtenbacheri]|uniref:protein PTHB1 isoform X2 n=1 Tax=Bacillus rossius redtenbacheri TaxID=93214 RepID=UPI002FDD2CA8